MASSYGGAVSLQARFYEEYENPLLAHIEEILCSVDRDFFHLVRGLLTIGNGRRANITGHSRFLYDFIV